MFEILVKEFKEFFRDKANVFFTLLFPSLLVCLLGNLLAVLDYADTAVGQMNVQYSINTTDPAGVASIEAFLSSMEQNDALRFEQAHDPEQAKELVAQGELSAAVVFEQPLGVTLYKGNDDIHNQALESVFTAFSTTAKAVQTVGEAAPQALAGGTGQTEFLVQKDLGVNRTMLDYYAVAMTVMILFMGGMGGALSLQSERTSGAINRLLVSPKNKAALYVQKVFGSLPQTFLQVAVVMLTSTLFFGAHYAATWQLNLLLFGMFFVCGMAIIAVCAIIGMFLKANAMVVLMPVFWTLMFLSGTFSKEIFIEGITNLSPVYLIQNAAFDLTVFGKADKAWIVLAVSAAVLAAAIAVGAALFEKRGKKA